MKFVQFFVTVGRRITIDYKFREGGRTLRHLTLDEANNDLIHCLHDFGETNFVFLQSDIKEMLRSYRTEPSDPVIATNVLRKVNSWVINLDNAKSWSQYCDGEYFHDDALKLLNELQNWMHVSNG